MRKFYSLVLMATALLIGTNAGATTQKDIQDAIDAAAGSVVNITLTSNVDLTAPIQIYAKKAEAGKTVNLNLAGFTISNNSSLGQKALIELYKGTLNITNGDAAQRGQIATTANCEAIKVFGAYEDVDDWTTLNVDANVTVSSSYDGTATLAANAISVLELVPTYYQQIKAEYAGQSLMGLDPEVYKTQYYKSGKLTNPTKGGNCAIAYNAIDYGSIYSAGTKVSGTAPYQYVSYSKTGVVDMAYGVKVNILAGAIISGQKYGIKINGSIKAAGTNVPSVYIAQGAEVSAAPEATNAAAVYSSGNGAFVIDGYVHGSTGVYVKGGSVSVEENAHIKSDNDTGNGLGQIGKGSGFSAGGNAIAIEGDNAAYTSEGISVQINGGKIEAGDGAYAVQNKNNDAAQSNPKAVTISGGEFEGGAAGCVTIDNSKGNVDVALEGGTFAGDIETLIAALGDDASKIISTVVAQEGSQATVVIGKSEEDVYVNPDELDGVNVVKYEASTEDLDIDLSEDETTLEYLSLTGKDGHYATLTVGVDQTLKVGQIVMNANGRIIVEAGAKLIVSGANGIFADNVENLVLRTSEDKQAIFLLNPAVANNKHPKATVEFISKSYTKSGSDWAKQIFGIPTHTQLTEITAKYENSEVATGFEYFDYSASAWKPAGYIHYAGQSMDYEKIAAPFTYYRMQHNAFNAGTVVTMKGELTGNMDAELNVRGNFWCGYANSYMAPIDGEKVLDMIDNGVDQAYYLYYVDEKTSQWGWWEQSKLEYSNINPMQPFLLRNPNAAAEVTVDYADAVYYTPAGSGETKPSVGSSAPARRAAANNITKAKILVRGEGNVDRIVVAEGEDFSAEFDHGYDVVKYMEQGIKMYVSADEKMGIFATNDLNNTYVGFKAINGGNYTLEFANVQGNELTLIDHETGARVAMVEGATYEFTADANSENDYRFEIVGRANMPTAIENTEAVKSAKGVYTITGQYVGEMNVWNALPAGVYVVNGEKRVK